jgi:membrane-bound lytic murein transglycosylase B
VVIVGLSLLAAYVTGHPSPLMGDDADAVATPSRSTAAARTIHAAPASFSFDDISPMEGAEVGRDEPKATAAPAKPKRIPRPPARRARATTDDLAGTAQAVLAEAYRKAVANAPDGCRIRVSLLAAIGQIESGSAGGRHITTEHVVSPPIYGPLLDGGPFATIPDTDGGRIDADAEWDRAVGPLQFIPGTWSWAGLDGDGDGSADPQNVFDAAAAAAGYLCRGGRDLSRPADLRAAIWSYNQSSDYLSAALEWISYFEDEGLGAMAGAAFRVGSGGRASELAVPKADPMTAAPPASASRPPTPTPTTTTTTRHTAMTTTSTTSTGTSTTSGTATTPTSTTTTTTTGATTTTQPNATSTGTPSDTATTTAP